MADYFDPTSPLSPRNPFWAWVLVIILLVVMLGALRFGGFWWGL